MKNFTNEKKKEKHHQGRVLSFSCKLENGKFQLRSSIGIWHLTCKVTKLTVLFNFFIKKIQLFRLVDG